MYINSCTYTRATRATYKNLLNEYIIHVSVKSNQITVQPLPNGNAQGSHQTNYNGISGSHINFNILALKFFSVYPLILLTSFDKMEANYWEQLEVRWLVKPYKIHH